MDAQRTTIAHPALSMINIKSFVPIILEQESAQFSSWAELFKIHARAFQVLHHILPSSSLPDEELSTDITRDKMKKSMYKKRVKVIEEGYGNWQRKREMLYDRTRVGTKRCDGIVKIWNDMNY
ncbi:hypothetical protein C2S53_017815 [Perilla frutescens var. hirtella]|uniref:Uncharacterized protein n=1 Tax=Perilla frutescens var. hirtella TaxID=608512 RepID=A0AAD4P4L5_PERFH|nr:hypothetical protein C2S53_017815 [Perilla frutescens var. hirtella]